MERVHLCLAVGRERDVDRRTRPVFGEFAKSAKPGGPELISRSYGMPCGHWTTTSCPASPYFNGTPEPFKPKSSTLSGRRAYMESVCAFYGAPQPSGVRTFADDLALGRARRNGAETLRSGHVALQFSDEVWPRPMTWQVSQEQPTRGWSESGTAARTVPPRGVLRAGPNDEAAAGAVEIGGTFSARRRPRRPPMRRAVSCSR
jgi:hypothetical protein